MPPDLTYATLCTNTCIMQHMYHQQNTSFIFIIKNIVLQIVQSALISKLPFISLSLGSYTLPDNIAQDIISELCRVDHKNVFTF